MQRRANVRQKFHEFGFSAGHELSSHTAPMPASLYFLEGEADLTLGEDKRIVKAGAFAHMTPNLNHGIVARTPLVMLLVMMKGLKRTMTHGN